MRETADKAWVSERAVHALNQNHTKGVFVALLNALLLLLVQLYNTITKDQSSFTLTEVPSCLYATILVFQYKMEGNI